MIARNPAQISQKSYTESPATPISPNDRPNLKFHGPFTFSGQMEKIQEEVDQGSLLNPTLYLSGRDTYKRNSLRRESQNIQIFLKDRDQPEKKIKQLDQIFTSPRRGQRVSSVIGQKIYEKQKKQKEEENQNLMVSLEKRGADLDMVDSGNQKLLPIGEVEKEDEFFTEVSKKGKGKNLLKIIMAKKYFNNFVENILRKAYVWNSSYLTQFQRTLADDLTYTPYKKILKNEQFSIFSKIWSSQCFYVSSKLISFLERIPIIEPSSWVVIAWDIFSIMIIQIIFFWLPLVISFDISAHSIMFQNFTTKDLEIFFLLAIGLDIIMNLNIAFIQKGHVIQSRKAIIINYFRNSAIIDLISFCLLLFIHIKRNQGDPVQSNLLAFIIPCLCFLLSTRTRVEKMLRQIEEYFSFSDYQLDLFGLVQLIFTVVLICHIFACTWHGVAYYSTYDKTWLDIKGIKHSDNITKYNSSFYWAAMTMITVGYGDIVPQNNSEMLTCNLTMFLACGVFAFSINSIGLMLQNLQSRQVEYKQSLIFKVFLLRKYVSTLKQFMKKNSIKIQLQTRIRNYFDYTWQEEMEQNDEEIKHLMGKLSNQLQEELKYELRVRVLKSNPSLTRFSEQTLKEISYVMEEVKFSPNETIISQDSQDDSALYLVEKGKIIILFKDQRDVSQFSHNNREFGYLQKGESFGEYSFFTGMKRTATAVSKEFSRLFKIKRENLLTIIGQNNFDKEIFSNIRDGMLFQQDFKNVKIKCFSCQQTTHMINECPVVHYTACKERVLKKHLYPIPQQRGFLMRKSSPYHHFAALIEMRLLQMTVRDQIQLNLNQIEQVDDSQLEAAYDDLVENLTYNKEITQTHPSKGSELFNNFNQVEARLQVQETPESKQNLDDQIVSQSFQRRMKINTTLQTAGFNLKKNTVVTELKQEQKSDENLKDNQEEQIINQKQHRRSQADIEYQITTPRQPPRQQNMPINFRQQSMDKEEHYDNRRRSNSQKKSLKLQSQASIESKVNIQIPRREMTLTKSIRTLRTRQSIKDIIRIDCLEYPQTIQSVENFDKAKNFTLYYPFNNLDMVVKKANWLFKLHANKKNIISNISLYTFNYLAIRKAHRMRKGIINQKVDENDQSLSAKGKIMGIKSLKKNIRSGKFSFQNRKSNIVDQFQLFIEKFSVQINQ